MEVQYYKEDKKVEEREGYLKKAVDLLRRWRTGGGVGVSQNLLGTSTIEFLDKYDKAVFIKKEDL